LGEHYDFAGVDEEGDCPGQTLFVFSARECVIAEATHGGQPPRGRED